jgi:hypothetical protein
VGPDLIVDAFWALHTQPTEDWTRGNRRLELSAVRAPRYCAR